MNVKNKSARLLCACLAAIFLISGLSACASTSEVPDGYQYATCTGEYFRLFVPTQWTVNTESGISSAYLVSSDHASVSMVEIPFTSDEAKEASPFEQFVAAHLSEVSQMSNYQEEKRFDEGVADQLSVDLTYFATVSGSDRRFRQVLIYRTQEKHFYLFTYTAPADGFETYLDIVDGILMEMTYEYFPFEGEDNRKIPEKIVPPEGMKLVSDNEVAYRFFAPESWIRDVRNGQNFVYCSEEDRSNVSMFSYDPGADASYTVADYWKICKEQYESTLSDFTLLSETEITLKNGVNGEKTAMVYEYTYTLSGVEYRVRQTVCYVGMIYCITYTALPELYEKHLEDVLAMEQALYFRTIGD